ncbi:fumarylacetoacetate hydrolase [Glutamicibacter halophytocola]|uniref:fumarylacetoacetate hydrolase family protein n=1 Tax=Glutamicibacter halophytocola TaxID=1933880 RepID=UPI0006D4A58C|nr:fumarylacetoacetate hydrolase family protein [Glutamicibacter halophytocola]ALG29594.1 fumarylacetoacetate hydrolase [Glutamicibacter halophytocola]
MPEAVYRIARVRPKDSEPAANAEQFFVRNDAADFDSAEGRMWKVIASPFTGSRSNQNSPARPGWHIDDLVAEEQFDLLSPCNPTNIFGMAHNTGAPGRAVPPQAFHKAASSVVGPLDAIKLDDSGARVDPEAELAIVIGRPAKNLTLENAREAVLGVTIGNDVTDRDAQRADELWISAKSPDTFTPVGPWIVAGLDDSDLEVGIVHNGEALATSTTQNLGWGVEEILVYLSGFMTLQPGDLVLTGFPAKSRPIAAGDDVICKIQGIGELKNPVVQAS